MSGPDREVALLLRERPDLLAVADAIAATQRPTRRPHAALALAAALAVVVAVALATPWRGHRENVVARALAAVGDGRVVHAVIQSNLQGVAIVDLKTGARSPVPQRLEYWYDAERGQLRFSIAIGGRVLVEGLRGGAGAQIDPALAAFATRYREALESGAARVAGRGRGIVWLEFSSGGPFGERVGVDARTYKPRLIEKPDARGRPAVLWHVVSIATGPPRAADFAKRRPSPSVSAQAHPLRQVAPARASRFLGWRPLWLGPSFDGDPIASAQVQKLTTSVRRTPTLLFAVSYGRGFAGGIFVEEGRLPGLGFRIGAPVPETEFGVPVPARGAAVVTSLPGGCHAELRAGGLFVSINGPREASCVAAARALRPIGGTR